MKSTAIFYLFMISLCNCTSTIKPSTNHPSASKPSTSNPTTYYPSPYTSFDRYNPYLTVGLFIYPSALLFYVYAQSRYPYLQYQDENVKEYCPYINSSDKTTPDYIQTYQGAIPAVKIENEIQNYTNFTNINTYLYNTYSCSLNTTACLASSVYKTKVILNIWIVTLVVFSSLLLCI